MSARLIDPLVKQEVCAFLPLCPANLSPTASTALSSIFAYDHLIFGDLLDGLVVQVKPP
jgi:hypothetical protein